jgi:subtilisin family serine protease
LQSRPEVDRVLDSTVLRPLHQPMPTARGTEATLWSGGVLWNQSQIHADQVWEEFKITGKGVVVGQSDSGADGTHPELAGSFRGNLDGKSDSWYDPWNQSTIPTDIGGHGTHTLGSAVGQHVGIAPGATWIGCVNLARNLGNPARYLDCMQFMLAPFEVGGNAFSGNPQRGANVLNNSWGCPPIEGCDPTSLLPAVRGLRAAGVFVVASAGNDGEYGCSSVRDPIAIYDDAFSVGAVDKVGNLADFSSLGPVVVDGSGRIKPDISAPGVGVLSSYPGGTYQIASGTSMAGPHVVGVVALMWSANPKLIGNIDRTEIILIQTAQAYKGRLPACVASNKAPNNAAGYGLVDAYRAVQMALREK